jgi:uncharacterized protein (TIGR02466 family)
MQTIPLWPVMMYDFTWDQHKTYQKDLIRVCHELETRNHVSNVASDAKQGLYESGFDFVTVDDPAVLAFAEWVKFSIFKSASNANKKYWPAGLNVSIEIHESWCHITREGGYHDMHIHPNSSWSAIYYLDTGDMDPAKKNGVNRFYNPNHGMYLDAGTAWLTANTSIDIQAESGQLFVFPSWVQHSAMPYHGKKERIVISVNARVQKAGDITITV